MLSLKEMIEKRRIELKNTRIDMSDIDYLNRFNTSVKSLAETDFFDIIQIFYMIDKKLSLKTAEEEVSKFKEIMIKLIEDAGDLETILKIMDTFYEFLDKYKNKITDISLSAFLSVKGASKLLILVKTVLKKLKLNYSEANINVFLKWMCTEELSDIIVLAINLKGVEEELNSVYDELDDLEIPDILPSRITKRLQNSFVNGVNGSYLKAMSKEFEVELNKLSSYKEKKQSEVNSLQKKIKRELRDLDLLEQDFNNGKLCLENIEKYKLTSDIHFLAMVELINQKNVMFNENFKVVEAYRKNPTNKLEVIFNEFGRNFNKLTDDEQNLLANGYSSDFIRENLNFITTSSLKFLQENDEVFVNILTQEIDDLMQLDSLFVRNKISADFILSNGKMFSSLSIKMLIHNVSKLDAQKVNFQLLNDYNMDLLLELNLKLFDLIVKYEIKFNDENLKHFKFLENAKLLNIIDKYIELGLTNQIQRLPNLITDYSEVILKRIVILEQLGEDFLTDKGTINQKARSGKGFYLGDNLLDDYIDVNYQMFMDEEVLRILDFNDNTELLDSLPDEINFIENYKKNEQVYVIGGLYFSRLKVLRCLKTLTNFGFTDYKNLLYQVLIYNYPKSLNFEIIEMLKTMDENIQRKQLK